jgi:hypothetical protein
MKIAGVPKVPKVVIPMPKPIKVSAPKIASVHIQKLGGGGFQVQHNMTHGPKPVPFVFSDPRKMLTHLNRIRNAEWREPDKNPAPAITRDLNLGPAA